jgi:phospholipid transport system substrate-binding protein
MTRNERPLGRRGFLRSTGLVTVACLLPAAGAAEQGPAPTLARAAEALIRATVDEVFTILRDPELARDPRRRMARLREAVDRVFDWVAMATSCLGHHWRKLTEAERAEFVSVFKELLAQRYMEDIDRFRGTEQVELRGSRELEGLIVVKTMLITSSREQVPMDYTLQSESQGLRVIDLAIENVSLVNHYRSTFDRFLVNKPFSELIAQLKRKLGLS